MVVDGEIDRRPDEDTSVYGESPIAQNRHEPQAEHSEQPSTRVCSA